VITTAIRAALRRKATGFRMSPDDGRDHRAQPGKALFGATEVKLPASFMELDRLIDLRNQGPINRCVLSAIDYGAQSLCALGAGPKGRKYDLRSTLAPYYWARALSGDQDRDGGCYFRDGFRAYSHHGAPSEEAWRGLARVNRQPGPEAYRQAHPWRGLHYSRIFERGNDRIDAVKTALVRRRWVVGGWDISKEFQRDGGSDTVDSAGKGAGRHAMSLSGYERTSYGATLYRSPGTWGEDWRDGGRVWFTENVLMEALELWVIEGWA
jgi:hypothetical protein